MRNSANKQTDVDENITCLAEVIISGVISNDVRKLGMQLGRGAGGSGGRKELEKCRSVRFRRWLNQGSKDRGVYSAATRIKG